MSIDIGRAVVGRYSLNIDMSTISPTAQGDQADATSAVGQTSGSKLGLRQGWRNGQFQSAL